MKLSNDGYVNVTGQDHDIDVNIVSRRIDRKCEMCDNIREEFM